MIWRGATSAAAAGGRGKGAIEIRTLKGEIKAVIGGVRSGELDPNDAAAMISGYRALKDYIELERRIREQDELLERLEALEATPRLAARQVCGCGRGRLAGLKRQPH